MEQFASEMIFINWSLKFVKWVLIIAIPGAVLALSALAIVDRVTPWPEAESTMNEVYGNKFRLCVGMSSVTNDASSTFRRSYLLVHQGKLATVSNTFTPLEGIRSLDVKTSQVGFWLVALVFISCYGMTIAFSICRIQAKLKGRLRR